MTKTDQLINALRIRFETATQDHNYTDALTLGYLRGLLGVLEKQNHDLERALDYHLQDCLEYNAKQSRLQEAA